MRGRALPVLFLLLLSPAVQAQVMWQPTPPPLVTAENEKWYRAGDAIAWNGDVYYPVGAPEAFNPYQMVRGGSYRGIPLYTDTTLEPYSIVFVPIGGGRLQPYERPRTGMLSGSVGSRAPLLPTQPSSGLALTPEGYVVQAAAPPTFARSYDVGPAREPEPMSPAVPIVGSLGTTRSTAPTQPVAAGRRPATVTNRPASQAQPQGINSVWFDYDGRRWVSAGKAVDLSPDFARVGEYRGTPVYERPGDRLTIYIQTAQGLVAPFKRCQGC
ncbi:MAG TPA: hypothetical protein VGI12_03995 [Vicinamibacterales bacterium]|jgi:hypothetical protein